MTVIPYRKQKRKPSAYAYTFAEGYFVGLVEGDFERVHVFIHK